MKKEIPFPDWKLHLNVWGSGKYRITIKRIYSSDNVLRFEVTGGKNSIQLEKRLNLHRQPWKLIQGKMSEENVLVICKEIDWKIKMNEKEHRLDN